MKLLVLLIVFAGVSYACKDKWDDWCSQVKSYCKNTPSVQNNCPKTCGLCVATQPPIQGPCKDKWVDWCTGSIRYCPTHPSVRRDCPETCGLCVATQPPTQDASHTQPPTQDATPTQLPPTGSASQAPLTQLPGSCGLRQVSSGKVIGGKDAKRGDWPWQILLQQYGSGMCGGTIIDKRYVVTAAHCVHSLPYARYYSVVVGETDLRTDEGSEVTIQAERIIVHQSYSPQVLNNDIALIKLKSDIPFGKYVQPACLPTADITPGHKNCYITGWGKIRHPGYMHTKLQQAIMPPVSNDVCYNLNRRSFNTPITKAMVCAGEGGVNPISGCHGDSGGPYVCEVNGKWELTGAVSWGSPRCSSRDAYTVFARINYFKQWISDTMRRYGV